VRSIWKGSISFGLVTIPVKLYSATEQKDVSFHQVRRSDGSRIKYKRVAAVDGEEVSYGDIAKGYELSSGETVVLTDEDFKDLPLATNRAIDVLQFVPLEELDPIFFEKSYYLEPDKAGTKPYVLLRDALEQSGKVAVVKVRCATASRWPRCACATASSCSRRCCGPTRSARPTSASSTRTSRCAAGAGDGRQPHRDADRRVRPVASTRTPTARRCRPSSRPRSRARGRQPTEAQPTSGTVVDLMAALRASVEAAEEGRPAAPRPTRRGAGGRAGPARRPGEEGPPPRRPGQAGKPPARRRARPRKAPTKAPAKKAARKSA
jgi:DNA end-binding protein Ku